MKKVRGFVAPAEDAEVQRALRRLIREARACGAEGLRPADDDDDAYKRACFALGGVATDFVLRERQAKARAERSGQR